MPLLVGADVAVAQEAVAEIAAVTAVAIVAEIVAVIVIPAVAANNFLE